MHSSTNSYVAIQNLYKAQAQKDMNLFSQCLEETLNELGLEADAISEEDAGNFIKHSQMLLCERGRELKLDLRKEDVEGDLCE